jgi:hypothetical protein
MMGTREASPLSGDVTGSSDARSEDAARREARRISMRASPKRNREAAI